jgi:hypothetical protein
MLRTHVQDSTAGGSVPSVAAQSAHHSSRTRRRVQITFVLAFWWLTAFILTGVSMALILRIGRDIFSYAEFLTCVGVTAAHLSYALLMAAFVFLFKFLTSGRVADAKDPVDAHHLKVAAMLVLAWSAVLAVSHAVVYKGQVCTRGICTRAVHVSARMHALSRAVSGDCRRRTCVTS